MLDNPLRATGTAFRLRRPPITTNGFFTDVDPIVAAQLRELEDLLGQPVLGPIGPVVVGATLSAAPTTTPATGHTPPPPPASRNGSRRKASTSTWTHVFDDELEPKAFFDGS